MFKQKFEYQKNKFLYSDTRQSTTKKIGASILAIVVAFVLALLITSAIYGDISLFGKIPATIFSNAFVDTTTTNNVISSMCILIVASLAFLVAFKAGLFNMGISGQMLAGATAATIFAWAFKDVFPNGLGQIMILLVSIAIGMLFAGLIGVLKAYLNVNEVVSSIMLNWIIYYISILILNQCVAGGIIQLTSNETATEEIASNFALSMGENGSWLPLLIISLALVAIVWVVLKYTVFGKKIIATGLSKNASKAAGYNVSANVIGAMLVSGALAGVLGCMVYCGKSLQMDVTTVARAIPLEGFNGIAVGLIGTASPIAVIPISLFFAILQESANSIQTIGVDSHMPNIIFGIVVYGAAIISLFMMVKPYWWTIKIFKGSKYSKLKHHSNLDKTQLNEYVNEQTNTLKKYYEVRKNFLAIKPTIELTRFEKFKITLYRLQYKIAKTHNNCLNVIRKWQKKPIVESTIKMNRLVSKKTNLTNRKEKTIENKITTASFRKLQKIFAQYGIDEIDNKKQLKRYREIFMQAYFNVLKAINNYYKKINVELQKNKKEFIVKNDMVIGSNDLKDKFDASVVKTLKDKKLYKDVDLDIEKRKTKYNHENFLIDSQLVYYGKEDKYLSIFSEEVKEAKKEIEEIDLGKVGK